MRNSENALRMQAWGMTAKAWVKSHLRRIVGRYPEVYFALGRFRGEVFQRRRVTPQTDIVIDGYPRSANSFSVGAFKKAQYKSTKVAHHLHVPAHIMRACDLGIPTLLLVRHPVDAIVSHRALHREGEIVENAPRSALRIGFRPFFHSWIDFYDTTREYIDSVVVGLFDQVVTDFEKVLEKVNSKYDTKFSLFDHTEENEKKINSALGYHAGPSERRKKLKEEVRDNFEQFRCEHPGVVQKSVELYKTYEQEAAQYNHP